MAIYIGLDVGGTKLMVAAADADGQILRRTRSPTPAGLEEGLALLHEMIAEVAGGQPVAPGAYVGVGGCGQAKIDILVVRQEAAVPVPAEQGAANDEIVAAQVAQPGVGGAKEGAECFFLGGAGGAGERGPAVPEVAAGEPPQADDFRPMPGEGVGHAPTLKSGTRHATIS